MSTLNIILCVVLVAVIVYLVYILAKHRNTKEHFTTEEESSYDARLETMKIFDLVLNRKPTADEIDKYSQFHNEQDILVQVLQDYKSAGPVSAETATQAPTSTPATTTITTVDEKFQERFQEKESIQKIVADLQLKLNELKTLVNVSA
jgi:hypothetical protein